MTTLPVSTLSPLPLNAFALPLNRPNICPENIPQQLNNTIDLLFGEFQTTISFAFHTLHQKRADLSLIETEHKFTANNLKVIHERVVRAWESAQKYYTSISVDTCVTSKVVALELMLYLDAVAPLFLEKSTQLQKLLTCKTHQADLKYFKEKVKELDSLADWGNALYYLPGKLTGQLTPAHKAEKLTQIYDEVCTKRGNYCFSFLLKYMLYVAEQIGAPEEFVKNLKTTLGISTLVYEHGDIKQNVLSPSESNKLAPVETFRAGRSGKTLPGVGYSDVTDVTQELEGVERSLKELQAHAFSQLRLACAGKVDFTATVLQSTELDVVEKKISGCFNVLISKTFSSHTCWLVLRRCRALTCKRCFRIIYEDS